MENRILGLHHITAIAANAQRNLAFYTKVLGVRLVKKTVNFDDPGTYHFYYGDETGTPGTGLTFFPWEGVGRGHIGTGMATEIGYSVPGGSLDFWMDWLERHEVRHEGKKEKFGEQYLAFSDPDGLRIKLVVPAGLDPRKAWESEDLKEGVATKGFQGVTLLLQQAAPTAQVLSDILGYRLVQQEGNEYRFSTDGVDNPSVVDIIEAPQTRRGVVAAGTNHHVAFRVKDERILMEYRQKIESFGLSITPKIDRDYFFSLYFREPGGILFEIATDNPGFTKDESIAELGSQLKLPKQYEASRREIERMLPALQ
jgi:glyoxalase family protein